MKKLLIPLLACLLAVWSCKVESTYTATNVQDIVNVVENKLVTDTGLEYTVVGKAKDVPEMEEGGRYYMVFDILNINLDISITSAMPVDILVPLEEDGQEEITAHDPLIVAFNWIGARYIDLGFSYYYDPTSNCAHEVFARYTLTDNKSILNITIYHDGNDENPAVMDKEKLKTGNRVVSIPINENWNLTAVNITMNMLGQNPDGSYIVVEKSFSTR